MKLSPLMVDLYDAGDIEGFLREVGEARALTKRKSERARRGRPPGSGVDDGAALGLVDLLMQAERMKKYTAALFVFRHAPETCPGNSQTAIQKRLAEKWDAGADRSGPWQTLQLLARIAVSNHGHRRFLDLARAGALRCDPEDGGHDKTFRECVLQALDDMRKALPGTPDLAKPTIAKSIAVLEDIAGRESVGLGLPSNGTAVNEE